MADISLTPIVQPIIATAGAVITGLLAYYVPKAIAAFEARTGIVLSAQQQDTIRGAVKTAAGQIETLIDQQTMRVLDVHTKNPTVIALANAALHAVPDAMNALGMTQDSVAKMIVGAVDTGSRVAAPVG
jgi:hypothetical protein